MSKTLEYFKQITTIPRPSKKEDKIRDFLINWAKDRNLKYKVDSTGNLVIYVPGKNCNNISPIILQAHMDMVCVKTADSNHDFLNNPLDIYEEDGFLKARNTTLGADNGIGVALAMAAVDFEKHPPLELIFTIDEEQGMSGVLGLDFSLLSGKKVINLDSENENEIIISSAGGARINIEKTLEKKKGIYSQYKLDIFGMKGGHSGVEIHKNHGNSVKLFFDFLKEFGFGAEIVSITGGIADNVIPSFLEAIIGLSNLAIFEDSFKKYIEACKQKYDCPDLNYKVAQTNSILEVVSDIDFILHKISDQNIGILKMSEKISGLVETSINLGIINLTNEKLELTFLPRSSNMPEFEKLLIKLQKHFGFSDGYNLTIHSRYPGWQDNPIGELVRIVSEEISQITGKKPEILAIHAGLECGALVAGLGEGAQAVSIGPNLYDIHSVSERVEIASVEKMERVLEKVLERM